VKKYRPTESELAILQILWKKGPSTVRFVNDELNKQREVGYTTTLKIMQIMADKGLVDRNTNQRMHIYTPAVKEKDTKNNLIQNFLETTFGGSAKKLILQTLGSHNTSKEELEEIKRLISELENKNQK
jgi:predicted transcriptional regulator